MTRALFDKALITAADLAQKVPAQREFIPWPTAMPFTARAPNPVPAIDELEKHPGEANPSTRPLQQALMALARHVEWRHTYTEAEVGKDFLRRYGWFELAGPQEGYFQTDQTRMTVGYWGPNLDYPWHLHEAEELYLVVSGQAKFEAEGQEARTLKAGDTIYHRSNQPHAMTTQESGILTFVLWRGAGLSAPPRMGGAG